MIGITDSPNSQPSVTPGFQPRAEVYTNIHHLFDYLIQRAASDPTLRTLLRDFARSLDAIMESLPPMGVGEPGVPSYVPGVDQRAYMPAPYKPSYLHTPSSPLLKPSTSGMGGLPPRFHDGSSLVPPAMSGWQAQAPSVEDLPIIESRCRLKAEASRWAGQRQRLIKDGVDFHLEVEPRDRDIISRAKALPECFLWMNHKDSPVPRDLSIYDDMAGAFETTAFALSILRAMLRVANEERELFEIVLQLTAEAQSCVRGAVIAMDGKPDRDQMKIFYWLRSAGADYQILIRRFMRQDDIADFRSWPDVRRRLDELDSRIGHLKAREPAPVRDSIPAPAPAKPTVLSEIQEIVHEISKAPTVEDWEDLIEAVDEAVDTEVPPNNKDLRDLLIPIIDKMPEAPSLSDLPLNFKLVLREIDRYRTELGDTGSGFATEGELNDEVKKVAKLLKGKAIVLIGGDRREAAGTALLKAFGLKDLVWIETREHQPFVVFEPLVSRADVAAVVLAVKWSSHSFAEVKEFCDRHDKPLVRLPNGYGPNHVAHQILTQVAEQLADAN